MRIYLRILSLVIGSWLLFAPILIAQDQQVLVEHYSIEDDLSQTAINTVIQDSRGFLWIGTQDGLNKFDGYNFNRFKNDPSDTTTISNNYIHCIYEDNDNNIWVGTNYGLNKFDAEKQTFFRYLNNDSSQN